MLLFSYYATSYLSATIFVLALVIYLAFLPAKTRHTRLLLIYFIITATLSVGFLLRSSLFVASVARPASYLIALYTCFSNAALLAFVYSFPRNSYDREARIAVGVFVAMGLVGYLYYVSTTWSLPVRYNDVTLFHEFQTPGSARPMGFWHTASFLWILFVALRKLRRGSHGPSGRLLWERQAARAFTAAIATQFLFTFSYLLYTAQIISFEKFQFVLSGANAIQLFLYSVIYLNYSPQPSTFMAKLVGISLVTVLLILALVYRVTFENHRGAFEAELMRRVELVRSDSSLAEGFGFKNIRTHEGTEDSCGTWPQVNRTFFASDVNDISTYTWQFCVRRGGSSLVLDFPYVLFRQSMHEHMKTLVKIMIGAALLFLVVFPFFFYYGVAFPLRLILAGVRDVNAGRYQTRVDVLTADELGIVARSFNRMVRSIREGRARLEALSANLEAEVVRQTEQLVQASEELRKADRAKTTFFQNISHELRTPLTLIYGPVSDAERRNEPIESDTRRMIFKNTRRLLRLVNQLLDLQRIVAGRMELDLRSIEPGPFIKSICDAFYPYTNARNIALTLDVTAHDLRIAADPDKIERCVYNYLSNAVRFTPAGGAVHVQVAAQGDGVVFRVSDTGRGIASHRLPGLFSRFGHVEINSQGGQAGTGLGLSLVRELISLHGGTVGVESEPGKGSTFSFWLPASSEVLPAAGASAVDIDVEMIPGGDEDVSGTLSAIGPRVIVVEDHADMRAYVTRLLSRSGYDVLAASDGARGWQLLIENSADLLLVDLMLPELSGAELIGRVRGDARLRTLPVVLMTARADAETRKEAHSIGADNFLSKPFDESEILAIVRNLLHLKANETRLQRDLEMARRIQTSLLPAALPALPGARIAAFYQPMDAVGGDLYDFHVYEDGRFGVFIADICGHGVSAAMLASMVKLAFSLFAPECETPAALLQNLNTALVSGSAGSPVTAQYLIVAPDRRSATLASAGHPPPILSRNGETIQMLSSGPMLGVVDPIQARFFRTELQAGDRLYLYTDGLVPTKQDAPDLRMHPLHKAIINSGNTDLESQLKEIVRSLRAGQAGFADDATILGISID